MKRIWLVFFVSIICFQGFGQKNKKDLKRAVLFGEHSKRLKKEDNVFRIFLDKDGYYYPDRFIEDKSLKKSKASLQNWYKKHPEDLDSLCYQYYVPDSLVMEQKIEALNDSIIATKIRLVNKTAENFPAIDILIHGFRKKAYGKIGQFSSHSSSNNRYFRRNFSRNNSPERLFVEIYWDSQFMKLVQTYKFKGYKVFERSGIPNAERTGLALRKLIPYFKNDKINIISHSLGAVVAAELGFNAYSDNYELPTPSQKEVNFCFIAPAMGSSPFNKFYERSSSLNYRKKDNYRICILYNENDFVLRKQFEYKIFKIKSSPLEYGDTTLGCDYEGAIEKIKILFEDHYFNGTAPPLLLDCSSSGSRKMTCHSMGCYTRHENFAAARKFLIE